MKQAWNGANVVLLTVPISVRFAPERPMVWPARSFAPALAGGTKPPPPPPLR